MDGPRVDALRIIEITTIAKTQEDALQRLSRAVSQWVQTTEAGRHAWIESSEDFNVGDLAEYLSQTGQATPSLQRFFMKEGITRVKDVFVLTDAGREHYDRVLANVKI